MKTQKQTFIFLIVICNLFFSDSGIAQWEHDGNTATKQFIPVDLKYPHAPNRLVAKFKQPYWKQTGKKIKINSITGVDAVDALGSKYGIADMHYIGSRREGARDYHKTYVLKFKQVIDVENAIADYSATGLFEYVYPDYIAHTCDGGRREVSRPGSLEALTPNVQYFDRQWNLHNDGTFNSTAKKYADIDMLDAWKITTGDSSIIVGMIDEGVKLDHPSFAGRFWHNMKETLDDGEDNDNNGYADDYQGWDFADQDNDPYDEGGHGTNTAGIVGANGNDGGLYAGIDWKCKLMVCKVSDATGQIQYSVATEAINYAVDNGAKVLNMSFGGPVDGGFSDVIQTAYEANVFVVPAMGNDDTSTFFYPAGCEHAFAVGATGSNDHRAKPWIAGAGGSNYNSYIKVVAPGNWIYMLNFKSDSSPDYYSGGTSFAAPHVTGLAALLLAQDPSRIPDTLAAIIIRSAQDQIGPANEDKPGWDQYYGYGRIDALQALGGARVGVKNSSEQNRSFTVFPNPANTSVQILGVQESPITIEIADIEGRIRYSGKDLSDPIDVGNFENGLYIVRLETKMGMSFAKFIVIH